MNGQSFRICMLKAETKKYISDLCLNLMNLSRISNPPKTSFN